MQRENSPIQFRRPPPERGVPMKWSYTMSMPSFPEQEISTEQALNMILASIAMEELALSHIMNAEGEKLQYVLGTLPGGCAPRVGVSDILAVNRSVTELLETAMQNQMLLKGKMEKVLTAKAACTPPPCTPPPCGGVCPHGEAGCPPCWCEPDPCPPREKSRIRLVSASTGLDWRRGCRLPWRCESLCGTKLRWYAAVPAMVYLCPGSAYRVEVTLCLPAWDGEGPSVSIQSIVGHTGREIAPLPLCSRREGGLLTLSGSVVLTPEAEFPTFPIFLCSSQECIRLVRGTLGITEL